MILKLGRKLTGKTGIISKEINWEDGDNIKSLLIKLGYGRDDIIQMLKEI